MEWKNIYRGLAMGISDSVPGVSGGTIAVIMGIYDQLIAAINGIFTKDWKKHLSFLIPLAIGAGLGLFAFANVMDWLLNYHEKVTFFFFTGLIIGILPFLFREVRAERELAWYHFLLLLAGVVCMVLLPVDMTENAVITEFDVSTYVLLFLSGILASAAMILPGISGSLVFVVMGVFRTVIHAVKTLDIKILFIVACGIGIGIILMSKLIHYALKHFRTATFSFLIGLVIGSIYKIFPGWADGFGQMSATVIVFAAGLIAAYVLGKVEH